MRHYIFYMLLIVCLCGCGENYHFKIARIYESKSLLAQANHHYQKVINRYPKRAAEAMFMMGENFRRDDAVHAARRIYIKIIEKYPNTKWADLSMESLMNSPDYFPLKNGSSWVEGDSETGGRNMKVYLNCSVLKSRARIKRNYYAGKREVKQLSISLYYKKRDFELREYKALKDTRYAVLIKYPVEIGTSWRTKRDGQEWVFRVVDTDANVKVRAGRFLRCLKISEQNVALKKSIKYIYYAPGVGRILTTTKIVGTRAESRNSELLSHKQKLSP